MFTLLLPLLLLLQFANCELSIVHERRESPLDDANILERTPIQGDTLLPIRIGLRQNEKALTKAEDWLMDVSDPDSSNYGKHWTQAEVIKAFQPSDEAVNAVRDWLSDNGIRKTILSDNKLWLAFDVHASVAEALLQTKYFEHRTRKGEFEAACDEYSVPEGLTKYIDYITPGVKSKATNGRSRRSREYFATRSKRFPDPVQKRFPPQGTTKLMQTTVPFPANDLQHCHWSVSPACLRAMYNYSVADASIPPVPGNSLGLFESFDVALQGDMNKFFAYYTDIPNGTAPIYDSIDGAVTRINETRGWRKDFLFGGSWRLAVASESNLDYQISFPVIYPQNITTFQTDDPYRSEHGYYFNNDFLDAIDGSYCTYTAFNITGNTPGPVIKPGTDPVYPDPRPHGWHHPTQCGVYKPTNVISLSILSWEYAFPSAYLKRQCLEWLKLALQGISVFASSGDGGVACEHRLDDSFHFNVGSPATCPFVTAVGGTLIRPFHSVDSPEEVWSGSGGGFSDLFLRPAYQNAAVGTYFAEHDPGIPFYFDGRHEHTNGSFSRNGRGVPDVAAISSHVATIGVGEYRPAGGTSAAAPFFAALITRVNEERLRAGKARVGFINPTLYKYPQMLTDIYHGNNTDGCPTPGFEAVPGWDPATGLGTPDYGKMLEVFMSLP